VLPNFLIIGAPKAGTSSLYAYLRAHPEVFMPEEKELDFFVAELNWQRGRPWYESQFETAGEASAIGEASPRYSYDPVFSGVPERIASLIPEAKLIYLVRHPIDRIRSHYVHKTLDGSEKKPAAEAIRHDPAYLATTRYGHQIERFLEVFPRERLLVVRAEDLRDDRWAVMSRVLRFLEVDATWKSEVVEEEFHRSDVKQVAKPWARRLAATPIGRKVRKALPDRALEAFRPSLTRSMKGQKPDELQFDDALQSWILDELKDDLHRLQRNAGADFDLWSLN
jgi:hypothetical protein